MFDPTSRQRKLVLPNAVDVLGAWNEHAITNLRRGSASAFEFPSFFRLAKLVTGEIAPLEVDAYHRVVRR